MPDFGQNNPQIQEAFLELKTVKFAKLRVGKFKEPIGLEVLRSDRELTFAERSLASDLVPLRYIGAQLSGSVLSNSDLICRRLLRRIERRIEWRLHAVGALQ